MRTTGGSATTVSELAFQRVVRQSLRRWIERTAAAAAAVFAVLNQRLAELRRLQWKLERELAEERRKADSVSVRLEVSVVTIVAVLVTGTLGTATAWPVFEQQGWPLPLVVLAAIGVAAVEVALAAGTGAMSYALVLDEHGSVFELTPKQRTWTIALAVIFGVLTLTLVVALALLRAAGADQALWLALGVAAAALGVYTGAAMYENRHHLRAAALSKQLDKADTKADEVIDTHAAVTRSVQAQGRTQRAVAAELDHRGELTFEATWRRYHRSPDAIVPLLPQLVLPTDAELDRALLVALREPQPPSAEIQPPASLPDAVGRPPSGQRALPRGAGR